MLYFNWKPQKGKAFENLPAKILKAFDDTEYLVSTKYDGNQIFITKYNNLIRFFTSDWKEFTLELVADELRYIPGDFILVGEFMHECLGKLGDRRNSAILTTYRTNFNKKISNIGLGQIGTNIKVFDVLDIVMGTPITQVKYRKRLVRAENICNGLKYISVIKNQRMSGKEAKIFLKVQVEKGWEGYMLVEPDSFYELGKRVNHSIKLKSRKTVDLKCTGVEFGEGKYQNMIGALCLEDKFGRKVSVGSGLDDLLRAFNPEYFIGKIIEIEYEQIMDTYIQPTFIGIRNDKKDSD